MKRTLKEFDIPRSSFYRWYRACSSNGLEGLKPKPSQRRRFWNRIPEKEREWVVKIAIEKPELSPRELAWHITDTEGRVISESSVYRILKRCDLVTSPNYIVISAADECRHETRRVHELRQTGFTWLKVTGRGWY